MSREEAIQHFRLMMIGIISEFCLPGEEAGEWAEFRQAMKALGVTDEELADDE